MNELMDRLVLVADDDSELLAGILAWLRRSRAGFAVMGTDRGDEARRLLERHRPQVVVSDMRMPGLGGLELMTQCQELLPEVRFVFMSAFSTAELEQQSLCQGAVKFLRKPFDMEQLEQAVLEAMEKSSRSASLGFLSGLSVAGVAQLLEAERQSIRLLVEQQEGHEGYLEFREGRLVDAVAGRQSGQDAALRLLGLSGVRLRLAPAPEVGQTTIEQQLAFLLMEAARLQDEAGRAG